MFQCVRRLFLLAIVLAVLSPYSAAVGEESYPSRQITIIQPFAPGGVTDILARVLAKQMNKTMGQTIIVEARTGADGIIGLMAVARAKPDGYTIGIASRSTLTQSVHFRPGLPFNPLKDVTAVSNLANQSILLNVLATSPVQNFAEFLALGKAKPNTYSVGVLTPINRLSLEVIKSATGADFLAVPYKGVVPAQQAVLSGQIDAGFNVYGVARGMLRAGRVRAIAVTSLRRDPALPDVPAISEFISNFDLATWLGVVAPAGTPPAIVERISKELSAALDQEEVRTVMRQNGLDRIGSSPAEFSDQIRREYESDGELIRKYNMID